MRTADFRLITEVVLSISKTMAVSEGTSMKCKKPKILCVDDDPRNLSLLNAMLTPRGYDVVMVANGREAMEEILTGRIDICLLDIMMPGMDGLEVCQLIKSDERNRNIPVVLITSLTDKANRIQGIVVGADDFISKPFDKHEVLARIKMLLHVKSMNDRLYSAYNNIARLSAIGEQIITDFDPARFNFMEKIDSIVKQIIRKSFDLFDSPQIVVIGMIDQAGGCEWLRYDSIGKNIDRSAIKMNIDHKLAFASSSTPTVLFYNEDDNEAEPSALVKKLREHTIQVSNMVQYSSDSFCAIAINYGREVTTQDATVLSSVVMQSLFLKQLAVQVMDTKSAFEYTIFALARASEVNDEDTGDHVLRVGNYCALIAKHLKMPEKFVQDIRIQSSLHDVGKIHISPSILKKSGTLTNNEWQKIKNHSLYGSIIIGDHPQMLMAHNIAISHHERYDGGGYPHGLSGEKIPIEGRIMNLADQYDAMRNKRCYKSAFDHDTTFRIITEGDGRTSPQHFDPLVLDAFLKVHERFSEIFILTRMVENVVDLPS